MESISVRQRLRPVRYCFVVRPDDQAGFIRAASLNTIIWGGIYNPIVPGVSELDGYIREFDPDYLVNFSGQDLPATLAQAFQFRVIGDDDLARTLEPGDPRRRRLTLGLGIEPVLRHVSETDLRDAAASSRVALATDVPEQWVLYAAASFGTFASLPDLGGDITGLFRSLTRATDVAINPTEDIDVRKWLFPIELTGYGIRRLGFSANFSSHVVFVGDHQRVEDMAAFWNIRATGRHVWFVPVAHYERHRTMLAHMIESGRYAINPHVENHADIQRAPSVSEETFKPIAEWIRDLGIGPAAVRVWQPRFGFTAEYYAGDIHAADLEGTRGDEISILADGRMTPIKLVDPLYLDDDEGSMEHEWAIELQIGNPFGADDWMCQLPKAPGTEKLARRVVLGGRSETTRLGRNGIVVTTNHLRSTAHPSPIRTFEVFQALLEEATGYDVALSQPGIYAEQIVRRMGSLAYNCRTFKIRGVRDVIDRLSRGATLTKGNMAQIVMSTELDQFGQNWREELYRDLYVVRDQGKLNFSVIFNELLEKRVIRPGLDFTCHNCNKTDWHHVSEFTEEYTCRYCFERQRVPFANKAEWQYRADGLFQIDKSAQGSIATIVALWRLNEVGHGSHGRYCTGVNFCKAGGAVDIEIDYAYLQTEWFGSSYDLVLGEAKNFNEYDAPALARLMTLADKFERKPYLAVATLREAFTDAEKYELRGMIEKGYRVIPLTRLELDPYHLYERFDGTRHKYAVSFRDLAAACAEVNLR